MRRPSTVLHICLLACGALASAPLAAEWIDTLPTELRDAILWSADMEEGSLHDWHRDDPRYAGGGVFNSGGAEAIATVSADVVHSGVYSARATIVNAWRARNGKRAVRLMRWTDRPWNDEGRYFPRSAYYSTWLYIPEHYNPNKYSPWDPGDGGWWNVLQFKSDDENGVSRPLWALNLYRDDERGTLHFYLYSEHNSPYSFEQQRRVPLTVPIGRWVHIEARYVQGSDSRGQLRLWQDGTRLFRLDGVTTRLSGNAVWGIGNYTDHIAGGAIDGSATLYFDDAIVSRRKISRRARDN